MIISKLILGMTYLSKAVLPGLLFISCLIGVDILRKKLRRCTDYIFIYILFVYCVTLSLITGMDGTWSIHNAHNVQWVPFVEFDCSYYVLNIMAFLPMGILIPVLFQKKKTSVWRVLLCGFLISFAIEMVQFCFLGRLADVDDLAANTIGYGIGYFVFGIFRKIYDRQNRKIGMGTCSVFVSMIGYIIGVPYGYGMCLGDMLFVSWGIPIWSGNRGGTLSFQGIHYTLLFYLLIQGIAFMISKKNFEDYGAQVGRALSFFGMIFFAVLVVMNYVQK